MQIPVRRGGTKTVPGEVRAGGRTHIMGTYDTEREAAEAAVEGRKRLLPYSEEVTPSR